MGFQGEGGASGRKEDQPHDRGNGPGCPRRAQKNQDRGHRGLVLTHQEQNPRIGQKRKGGHNGEGQKRHKPDRAAYL